MTTENPRAGHNSSSKFLGKWLTSHVLPLLLPQILPVLLTLIWYPHWSIIAVIGLFSVTLLVLAHRNFQQKLGGRLFWTASIALFLPAMTWVTIGPFIVSPRPTYVFSPTGLSQVSTMSLNLVNDHPEFGTLMILSDPVRPHLVGFMARYVPGAIRQLDQKEYGSNQFILMPLISKFERTSPGPVPSQSLRELFIPGYVVAFAINFKLPRKELDKEHGSAFFGKELFFRPGLGGGPSHFLAFHYLSAPDRPPWEAIQMSTGSLESQLRYAALLDHAITLISAGETNTAFLLLNEAINYAGDHTEQARVFTIMGSLADKLLTGNLGSLQALMYFNRAFELVRYSLSRKSIIDRTPAENWIYRTLLQAYGFFGYVFQDRVTQLRALDQATSALLNSGASSDTDVQAALQKVTELYVLTKEAEPRVAARRILEFMIKDQDEDSMSESWFVREEARLRKLTPAQLVAEAKRLDDPDGARLFVALALNGQIFNLFSQVMQSALAHKFYETEKLSAELIVITDALRAAAQRSGPVWSQIYLGQLELLPEMDKILATVREDLAQGKKSELDGYRLLQQLNLGRLGFPLTEKLITALLDNKEPTLEDFMEMFLIAPVDMDWWDRRYLEWVCYQIGLLYFTAIDKTVENETRFKRWAAVPIDSIKNDHQGRGMAFIPGLIFLAMASDEFKLPSHENLKKDLETSLEIRYSRLLGLNEIGLLVMFDVDK